MVTSVSGREASSEATAVPRDASERSSSDGKAPEQDTVQISATAQEVKQPTAAHVRLLHAQGESVSQIATKLAITPHAVQTYPRTPGQTSSKSK